MEQLAKNLLALRMARKLPREKVSKALELSAKTYERYEKNVRDPSAPVLVKLADYYGVTLDQLVGREPLPFEMN
ncbi:helix-turn-helix domain-containing protein [uncultured Oscillibacter sp.]|jgi:transcriptional regulator with XRE-family HTH domain|uniref:helix-turn-helix domain-containing protein n=1 Tax=uncultured Oscillibacter sp. TaxID=876091 RepID=UPI0025DAB2CE|nr:helix-turn-helix transcriptional regulator [uncultured Oscillibacter sp.]